MADTHITICRNPYDRALSIWAWTNGKRHVTYTFDEMLREYLLKRDEREYRRIADRYMFEPCSEYHDRFIHDHVIHLENVAEEFAQLTGLVLPFASTVRRWTKHPPRSELTPEQQAGIQIWAKEDFDRYGYSRALD